MREKLREKLRESEPFIIIYTSLIVAGSFLHNTEFIVYIIFGWFLFLAGIFGILSVLFDAFSSYFIKEFESTKSELSFNVYAFLKYLKNVFEITSYFSIFSFMLITFFFFFQLAVNPSLMTSDFNISVNATTFMDNIQKEFKILNYMINIINILMISLFMLAGLILAIPLTWDEINKETELILKKRAISYKPSTLITLRELIRDIDEFRNSRIGKLLIVIAGIIILAILIILILDHLSLIKPFKFL